MKRKRAILYSLDDKKNIKSVSKIKIRVEMIIFSIELVSREALEK